jgi:hypothetical protein
MCPLDIDQKTSVLISTMPITYVQKASSDNDNNKNNNANGSKLQRSLQRCGQNFMIESGWIKFNALKIVPLTAYQNVIEILKNLGTT